jgi:hypothetical protein
LTDDEIADLEALDFDRERRVVARYWEKRLADTMKLHVPDPDLEDFFKAHLTHQLMNCEIEPGQAWRFACVGSLGYRAFGNESCMMIIDLDRRGLHREARQCLESFMAYQGTAALPGHYSSQEGVLYGAGGYEQGGYNQHHGWILWNFAEHYRFTRDKRWLRRKAQHLIDGADWIIRERRGTLDYTRLGKGLLPPGSLEDITDWWQWSSNNIYSWMGLDATAWALEQIKHREAPRIRKAADAYHASLLESFLGACRRSPVVQLRDGTYVPMIPALVERRGRSYGWLRETLEGPLHFLIARAMDSRSQQARWIIDDYEDNKYLSTRYGYPPEEFERRWFDRGGYSQQACLFFCPEPYMYRDEPKHAVRTTFNSIAANFFPDVRMICEHALPTLADYVGDHFKTSDEANATGWLRKMFVLEEGEELWLGQSVPLDWMRRGKKIGVEKAATHFGPISLLFEPKKTKIVAHLSGPDRNPPKVMRLRFRIPEDRTVLRYEVNGKVWDQLDGDWLLLPGDLGDARIEAFLD